MDSTPTLNYARRISSPPRKPGIGYALLIILALTGLLATGVLFTFQINFDAYARLFGIYIGLISIPVQTLLVLVPAVIYAATQFDRLTRLAVGGLVAIPLLSLAAALVGLVLAFTLPHGGGC